MWRRLAYLGAGAMLSLVILEIVFQLLPTSTATRTGYYVDPNILTYPPGHAFRTSFGWALARPQNHKANNYGFVADKDFVRDPLAVAVIGDSFVEASMLPSGERPATQLQASLPKHPTFALGSPGSSVLDYAERVRFAASTFGITRFVVIMERGDVMQSVCGSGNVQATCIDRKSRTIRTERIVANTSPLSNALRRSALAQYLFSQLRVKPTAIAVLVRTMFAARPTPRSESPVPAPNVELGDLVTQEFFDRLGAYRTGQFVFVMLAPLQTGPARPDPVRARFIEAARSWGASVIDTEPIYRNALAKPGLSLTVSPEDAHWNREAIHMVVPAIAHEIEAFH